MSAQPTLLPGQSPPLAVITATDRGGVILIVTALCMAFSLTSICIRIYVRHEFSPTMFSFDDGVIGVAMVFTIFQSAAVFVAVSKGLGRVLEDISPTSLIRMQKAQFASDILYIIALWLTKCSVAFLFLRLSPKFRHVLCSKLILGFAAVTAVVSIFITALRCDLTQPWIVINAHCTDLFIRSQVVAAFDIITEIMLLAMSAYIVSDLQMTLARKAVIVTAFAFRLPVIIAAAFRLHYISDVLKSSDPTFFAVTAAICTQAELNYAVIAATIPCLRPFMTATSTHYGAPASVPKSASQSGSRQNGTRQSGTRTAGNLFSLASLSKSKLGRSQARSSQQSPPPTQQTIFGMDRFGQHEASITRAVNADHHSLESTESKQMIIRKDVDFAVEFERSRSAASSQMPGHLPPESVV